MEGILHIVKITAIIQVILIILFILIGYFTFLTLKWIKKRQEKQREQITSLLNNHFHQSRPLTAAEISYLKKKIFYVLLSLTDIEKSDAGSNHLNLFLQGLSTLILKPVGGQLYKSRHWPNRYLAAICFSYGFDQKEEAILLKLINDKTLLVSINAAKVAVKYANAYLINEIISAYSKVRRLHQSAYAEILVKENVDIYPIIAERLLIEENLYTKIFCYRILSRLGQRKPMLSCVIYDLEIDSIDLKISILNYLAHTVDETKNEKIYFLASDSHWEVRAVAARALQNVAEEKSYFILKNMLSDLQWWVRVNAANSLLKKGEKGIEILKKQSRHTDKYAYETAQTILSQAKITGS